jgi:carboxypeptidase D
MLRQFLFNLLVFCTTASVLLGQETRVKTLRIETLPHGKCIVLGVPKPESEQVRSPDGVRYTKLTLADSGVQNEYGCPALPFIHQTFEIPVGVVAKIRAVEGAYKEFGLEHPLWPHQPPITKALRQESGSQFVVKQAAYSGSKGSDFQKALSGDIQVTQYRKRGRDYVDVVARPFAYRAQDRIVRYPTELRLELSYEAPALGKAAGPRTGAITVLEGVIKKKTDLDWLIDQGFNFERRGKDVVEVYATAEEVAALKNYGLETREIPHTAAEIDDSGQSPKGLGEYHGYDATTAFLKSYTNTYPEVCRLVSIGRSEQNRELWALKLTTDPDVTQGKPKVRLVGGLHGDEAVAVEMCLYFVDLLATGSVTNSRIATLLANTEVWLLPMMNPDGRTLGTRFNAQGYDLNRSFPDGGGSGLGNPLFGPPLAVTGRPAEVACLMQFCADQNFTLAANFHSGSLVVNYPYDDDELGSVDSPSPDDALFEYVAKEYSSRNAPMRGSAEFAQGIVNGAVWYVVDGGLQDWSYRYLGCNEVTIELSNIKQPAATQLEQLWNDNRESMLSFVETVHAGAQGRITDQASGQPLRAAVKAMGIEHGIFSDGVDGAYHRMLRPGTYHFWFTAPGYASKCISNVLVEASQTTTLDAQLDTLERPTERLLLVTTESMSTSLPGLTARKVADGFEVQQVLIANGMPTNRIRSAIRDAFAVFPAEYVVLVGDTPQVPTFWDEHATDLPYALMDAGETMDDYAGKDTVLGRISLRTPTVVGEYVQKLNAFAISSLNRIGDLTWVANGHSTSEYDLAQIGHEYCITNFVPTSYQNTRFYNGIGSAATLNAHINSGTEAVIYSGHGGEFAWEAYDYGMAQLAGLSNVARVPIVIGHCCVSGSFNEGTCFAEAWLQGTKRGVAYVGASADTYWDEDAWMQKGEFAAMAATKNLSIGRAVDAGLVNVSQMSPSEARYYHTVYQVFGDPTLVMYQAAGTPLAIRTESLGSPNLGASYSTTLRATGGTLPYLWSLTSGQLPEGLSLTGEGLLSGWPLLTGTYQFTIQVDDTSPVQQRAFATFTVTVTDLNANLSVALDTTNLFWSSDGGSVWVNQSEVTHDGVDAAQSGAITHNGQTWVETVISGPGVLSFWWKVSSEAHYDYLECLVNGVIQSNSISGNTDWQERIMGLGAGQQTVRWRYIKDNNTSSGQDRGWLDQVQFVKVSVPTIVSQPQALTVIEGDSGAITAEAVGTTPLSYQWMHDGVFITGATKPAITFVQAQPANAGEYRLVVTNSYGAVTSAVARLTVVQGLSLAQCLDSPTLAFTVGGDAPWSGQINVTHDAADAVVCGNISNNQQSWIATTVTGPGSLSFWWKVSSESGYDLLELYTNGVATGRGISGNLDWQLKTVRLGDGEQRVEWRYSKDGTADAYLDLAWLDELTWTPDSPAPAVLIQPQDQTVCVGEPAGFEVTGIGQKPLSYQWFKGETPLARATEASYFLSTPQYEDAAEYHVVITNSYGAVTSAPAALVVLPPGSITTNWFAAPTPITIPSYGVATPYPSEIALTGVPGTIRKVMVTLDGLTHGFPCDISALLAGPAGMPVMLLGQVGEDPITDVTMTFDDTAPTEVPEATIESGVYRPTDLSEGYPLPSPAPGTPYTNTMVGFGGISPNGTWRLFISDDAAGDEGTVIRGWSLGVILVQKALKILDPKIVGGSMRFSFETEPGRHYAIEGTDSLNGGPWATLQVVAGDGLQKTVDISMGTTGKRFYRLHTD